MSTKRKLRALDLFAGCGGLTQGLKAAGYKVVGAVEIDEAATKVYRRNHRGVRVFRTDIRRLTAIKVRESLGLRRGDLDLLAGCPPCQGFSTLTTRNGHRRVEDPRNNLLFEFLRFARQLLPRSIMLENVPALAKEPMFHKFCKALEHLGYTTSWEIVNVADFGVPQRRRRLVLIAMLQGDASLAPAVDKTPTVREAIGKLGAAGRSGDILHDLPESRSAKVVALIARIPKDGGSRTDLPWEDQLACHQKCDGFKDVYGRMRWDGVAPTITSGCFNPSKGRFLHPSHDRCITLREAALLQTFPQTYWFDVAAGKQRIALMIGNALPPRFVQSHAEHLAVQLQAHRK